MSSLPPSTTDHGSDAPDDGAPPSAIDLLLSEHAALIDGARATEHPVLRQVYRDRARRLRARLAETGKHARPQTSQRRAG